MTSTPPYTPHLSCALLVSALASNLSCGPAGSSAAGEIDLGPATLSMNGTESTYLEVSADGAWEARPEPDWLTVDPETGDGDGTLTIEAHREDLDVDVYAGAITVTGADEVVETAPVVVRFPEVTGHIDSPGNNVLGAQAKARPISAMRPGEDYIAGEILIGLDEPLVAASERGIEAGPIPEDLEPSLQALETAAADVGARVGAQSAGILTPELGIAKVEIDRPDVAAAIGELERDGRVRYAEPNYPIELEVVNDELYDMQWHYQNLNLESAWEITQGYEETVVAVIDGDFHPDHPDLADNFLEGYHFADDNRDIETLNPDCNAHGTHVAGTVAAVTDNGDGVAGVAPNVKILPLNLAEHHGDPNSDPDDVDSCLAGGDTSVRAITYAAGGWDADAGQRDEPVDVINMSFGGSSPNQARGEALEFARDQGVTLITSAGNNGRDDGEITYPAQRAEVLAISATNIDDELANYSSFGPEIWVAAPGGQRNMEHPADPDFDARTLSTDFDYPQASQEIVEVVDSRGHGYMLRSGTSMSSPHAAGVAALVRSVNPDLSPGEVAQILAQTATDLGDEGRNEEFGYGLINAEEAVRVARDALEVEADEIVAEIEEGGEVIREVSADAGGSFELGALRAGDYTVRAGTTRGGELNVPGTVYGETTLEVDYSGNQSFRLEVVPR